MCGIAGILRLGHGPLDDSARAADRECVARMLDAMAYRGPDDAGLEQRGRVTMGARRLAILDLARGHQPVDDGEGRVWATLNGEIYNHAALRAALPAGTRLRGRSDTEVLPHLWRARGPELVGALSGMFAIAVHDTRDGRLLLARDPLGIKPLYVARVGGRLLWASELKCLLCDPGLSREPDLDALGAYLALGFIPGGATPLRAVRRLRPGTRLLADAGGVREERWWAWPRFCDGQPAADDPRARVDEIGRRLADSTRAMLEADVPLGVLLSGGIDSSLLVASLPADVRRGLHTFCIGFEDGGHHDEREHARTVARHLGTRHHEAVVSVDIARELPRVAFYLDEPCADAAAVPAHLVARAAAGEVTVLLSGTGGDEIFGGYRRYHMGALLRRLAWMPRGAAGAAAGWLGERRLGRHSVASERVVWLRKLLEARQRATPLEAYLSAFAPCRPESWRRALARDVRPGAVAAALAAELVAEVGALPRGAEELAFTIDHLYYLPDDLLLKEDRATMGASVEGRFPFLDAGLVRFAAALPLDSRFDGLTGKRALRALAARSLPEGIARRPKHGFSVPIERWLRGPLDALAGDLFQGVGSGLFDARALCRWHDEHRRGADRSGVLWTALSHELWWREVASRTPSELAAAAVPVARRAACAAPDAPAADRILHAA